MAFAQAVYRGGIFLLLAVGSATFASAQSLPVFNPDNGHYYQRVDVRGQLDWFAAKAAAESMQFFATHGHLVTLTSQDENSFVLNNLRTDSAWLGGFQPPGSEEPAGGWEWVTGEPWSFTAWGTFEPNNNFGTEDGLMFGATFWDDITRTSTANGYIVEFPVGVEVFTWSNSNGGDLQLRQRMVL